MGVLPNAPAPDIKSSDIHVGFSPESTPTLGQRPSRDLRRLCHLGSKIKSKINGNDLQPSTDHLKCDLAGTAERDLGAGQAQVSIWWESRL
ncbi:hypothetical protein NJC38_14495 [Pseudomonas sp. 21LCFQ010]|uniref:hypothetical protein n=1 Tax=Pseudomonas sp. 21LCFQ010 TaxID=2957506 RepID=UPI002097BB07|nr:hypothetical protein [Pseudomonas sp. 21LCFQ010]MCO8163367.1 hypothetical protein [Pseudomonas sp. 21LCFQ010]